MSTGGDGGHGSHRDAGIDAPRVDVPDGADVYQLPPAWTGSGAITVGPSEDAIALAIDGTNAYWQTPGGSVYACPLGGCGGSSATLLSTLFGPNGITFGALAAGDGEAVFVSAGGDDLSQVAFVSPTHTSTTFAAPSGDGVGPLVIDGSTIYFMQRIAPDSGLDTVGIYSCALNGSCDSPSTVYETSASDGGGLGPLFVSGGEIYFVDDTSIGSNGGRVGAVSTGGRDARTLCNSELLDGGALALVVAGGYAYFTSQNDPITIYSCATSGNGTPVKYYEGYAPYGLATDGSFLYWTNYAPVVGSVSTCAVGPVCASAATVAADQNAPFAIVANATSVYWTTEKVVYRADR